MIMIYLEWYMIRMHCELFKMNLNQTWMYASLKTLDKETNWRFSQTRCIPSVLHVLLVTDHFKK